MFKVVRSIFGEAFTLKFLFFVILGLSLSTAVVFSAAGIMNGFSNGLKSMLRQDKGNFYVSHKNGLFPSNVSAGNILQSKILQLEGFLIAGDAKGVIVRGVDESFTKNSEIDLVVNDQCITIGESLAKIMKLSQGDNAVLGLISSQNNKLAKPSFFNFKVCKIGGLGLFLSDTRYVYMNLKTLQELLGLNNQVNTIIVYDEDINKIVVDSTFLVDSMDRDYSFVFHAVEVEKNMLGLILQIIVVIAVFNVVAFIIFLKERYAKEIFYLQALGLTKKKLVIIWSTIILFIVIISNLVAILMLDGINYLLRQSFFGLPAKIYHISSLQVDLTIKDYIIISGLSLLWPFISAVHIFKNIYDKSIISGVKREFGL